MHLPEAFLALKQKAYLQVFSIYLRYLIGSAFVIAAIGMGKLSGDSNLLGSMDKPIGELMPIQQFFRVMADSGLYWHFIGWSQIFAGALLMTQRFAKVGALIFFGIILNIFIITISYDFKGTPFITGLMLLAIIYLVTWDIESYLFLFLDNYKPAIPPQKIEGHRFWAILGVIMFASIIIIMALRMPIFFQLGIPFAEGFIGFLVFFLRSKKR